MRLPWVSRAHYQLLEHNYGELRTDNHRKIETQDRTLAALERADKRYDTLLEKFCAMKLAGGVVADTPAPIAHKEQDEVVRRINILSVGKPGLRAAMLNQVSDDRLLRGLGDMEILQRIEAGVTADEGVIA